MMIVGFVAAGSSYGIVIFSIIAIVINLFSYFFSDSIVLRAYGAKVIERNDNPRLFGIVKKIADLNGLPMPRVAIVPSATPNAFATGRNPKNAKVAVTTGILNLLNKDELEGVLAHELSHIKNRDILVSSIAAMLAAAVSFMSRMAFWGGGSRNRNTHPAIIILAFIAAPIASLIIRMAISRTREFGADKTGAEISGNPLALASALEKIERYSKVPMNVNPAVSQLFISDPLKAFSGNSFSKLFSTHPPTIERVRRLRQTQSGIRY